MNTLRQAKIGDTVKVVKLHGEGAVKRRIMDMGITKAICQAILLPVPRTEVRELSPEEIRAIPSARGTGELGSTGK